MFISENRLDVNTVKPKLTLLLISDHLSTTTTILKSHFELLKHKMIPKQRPRVKNGHLSTTATIFLVLRVIAVHRFYCILLEFGCFELRV